MRLCSRCWQLHAVLLPLLAAAPLLAQTPTAALQGKIVDASTQKAIPAAWIIANRTGTPPFSRRTKSGGDGAFQLQGLTPGTYSICVQAAGDQYLDPCLWNATATTFTLSSGQTLTGISLRLTAASVLNIQVQDPQMLLNNTTHDGRRPNLTLGVWGSGGLFHPAHKTANAPLPAAVPGVIPIYTYRLPVPRDTALNLYIASHDLKLGDSNGAALPANASQQPFQHATGDPNPKSFTFKVLGPLP